MKPIVRYLANERRKSCIDPCRVTSVTRTIFFPHHVHTFLISLHTFLANFRHVFIIYTYIFRCDMSLSHTHTSFSLYNIYLNSLFKQLCCWLNFYRVYPFHWCILFFYKEHKMNILFICVFFQYVKTLSIFFSSQNVAICMNLYIYDCSL